MSTIHLHQTTTSTPEQYVAGLTDFGPGRSKLFGNSADEYLKVHHQGRSQTDVTEGSGGIWERLHYDWSDPNRVVMTTTDSNVWGGASGHTYTFTRQPDGTITVFDNGAVPPVEKFSRVLVIRADTKTRRATLVRSYRHPRRLLSPFEGNAQFLPDGHVVVGWGGWPYVTEFARNGRVLFDAYFGHGKPAGEDADSYRAYRFVWHGRPTDRPALAVQQRPAVAVLFASWNGATEVRRWAVLAGSDPDTLQRIGAWIKTGFETPITVQSDAKYFAVEAVAADPEIAAREAGGAIIQREARAAWGLGDLDIHHAAGRFEQ